MAGDFQVVIIEDSSDDLRTATRVLNGIGIREVATFSRIPGTHSPEPAVTILVAAFVKLSEATHA